MFRISIKNEKYYKFYQGRQVIPVKVYKRFLAVMPVCFEYLLKYPGFKYGPAQGALFQSFRSVRLPVRAAAIPRKL
jgi:hypothetical protein